MALQGVSALTFKNGLKILTNNIQLKRSKLTSVLVLSAQMRFISSLEVTKNISIISNDKKSCKIINMQLDTPQDKPLLVMLSWLMAKKKHIYKYADIYLKHDFDVLNISISPWQLLWPTKGSQVIAKDILKFLEVNPSYSPLVLHGFSVVASLLSEVLVNISAERQRYDHIVNRIAGQIWDSAADITEISVGVPVAVFPRNQVLQNTLKQYILYHLRTFHKVATVHYIRGSQMFHTNPVKAPALIFISKTDPIGTEESNQRVRESWENMGTQVNWKCWEKSPHVGHYRAHPKEYRQELENFLNSLKISQSSKMEEKEKMKAKL